MKFAHAFQERLKEDGFPPHWIESAISYRSLKKCIKRVEKELADIGLDSESLRHILETSREPGNGPQRQEDAPFRYILGARATSELTAGESPGRVRRPFQPKLLFAVDEATGEPLDATLSPETRTYLLEVVSSQRVKGARITELSEDESPLAAAHDASLERETTSGPFSQTQAQARGRIVEVSLNADREFFSELQTKLTELAALQEEEQKRLGLNLTQLGDEIANAVGQSPDKKKNDLDKWRQIFELYRSSDIFFSTAERNRGALDAADAQRRLEQFSRQMRCQGDLTKFRRRQSQTALEHFMQLHVELLTAMKFQEINRTAMTKILKKFDKRTALEIRTTFPDIVSSATLTESIAKAVCFQLSTQLFSIIPRLDDYLCPVCFCIAFRPVRLRCQHIFCIRCLVVLQRAREDHCPLCRGEVVLEADSADIDASLASFLTKNFPKEVKNKQRENERAAGVDLYGEGFANARCCVM